MDSGLFVQNQLAVACFAQRVNDATVLDMQGVRAAEELLAVDLLGFRLGRVAAITWAAALTGVGRTHGIHRDLRQIGARRREARE